MQNETQKEIAGIQSATSRQNTKDQVYAQNEMLAYQQKESTARVDKQASHFVHIPGLSYSGVKSPTECQRSLFESHFASRQSLSDCPVADRKSGSAGMPRPISYAVFCLKKKKKIRITTSCLSKCIATYAH